MENHRSPCIAGQVSLPGDSEPLEPAPFFAKRLAFQISKNETLELWVTRIDPQKKTVFLGPSNVNKLAEFLK